MTEVARHAVSIEPASVAPELTLHSIFQAEHDFVWRSLVHLGIASRDADDVLQEVFLVVHRRLPDYDRSRPLRAWLWGIARNVAHNHRRASRREARRLDELGRQPEVADESLERAPELLAVRRVLLAMEEDFRDVLVLSDVEGLTANEIAAALDLKPNTVYSRLRLARERFQRALEPGPGDVP